MVCIVQWRARYLLRREWRSKIRIDEHSIMSNRKGVAALTREFILSIIRFHGSMVVNAERGIGSKNPHLLRLIKDGQVKLVRKCQRTELTVKRGFTRLVNRTYAVPTDAIKVEHVVCPSCGELCSEIPHDNNRIWRLVHDNHKYDCAIRTDHLTDMYDDRRKNEVAQGLAGRHAAVDGGVNYTGRQLERRYRRDKIKRAKRLAKVKPARKVELTVTYEQSIT
ncbi:hypothetical protein D3C85_1018550 [compost metagenome]